MIDIKEFVIKSANEFSDYEITGEESYIDLGFDDLDKVQQIIEVEHEFNISITDEEVAKLKSLPELVTLIKAKISSIEQRIINCIKYTTGVEEINGTEDFNTLDFDFFDNIEIMMELEKTFKINITAEEEKELHTIPDIVALVKSKLHSHY